jgi:hypothetical protein
VYRSYESLTVKEVPDEELLFELIRRNKVLPAPVKKSFGTEHAEVVVGIGNDDVAWMQIDADSLEVLKERVKKSNPGLSEEKIQKVIIKK